MSYDRKRKKLYELQVIRNGGPLRVNAEPVRRHVERLAQNMALSTIAHHAGVNPATVSRMVAGRSNTMRPDIAAALMRVRGDVAEGTQQVRAVGTMRRLQALRALGWSLDMLAPILGVTPQAISFITAAKSARVRADLRDAVSAAYDRMWSAPPVPRTAHERSGIQRAQAHARRLGWQPPLAWDDDTIDDPNAQPADMRERRTGTAEHIENIEWVLKNDPHWTLLQVAERLGVERGTLLTALIRAGRDDLRDRLADNAELAGFTVRRRTA